MIEKENNILDSLFLIILYHNVIPYYLLGLPLKLKQDPPPWRPCYNNLILFINKHSNIGKMFQIETVCFHFFIM